MYGMTVVSVRPTPQVQSNYTSVAQKFASAGAQCVELSATTASVGGTAFVSAVHAALPKATILGPDGMCTSAWVTDTNVLCTVATLDMKAYPGGKTFLAAYKKAYGVANPDPYSIYGYESAELGIHALSQVKAGLSGKALQAAVVKALFATKNLSSVLGTFSINSDRGHHAHLVRALQARPDRPRRTSMTFYKTLHPTTYLHAS